MWSLDHRALLWCLLVLAGGFCLIPSASAQTGTFRAQSQTAPKVFLHPGEEREITLSWLNTGSSEWLSEGANPVRLGTASPLDRTSPFYDESWLSINRLTQLKEKIPPGGTASLSFILKAPNRTGLYTESLALVAEYLTWLEGSQTALVIEVVPPGPRYRVINQSANPQVVSGGEASLWVELENIGTTIWRADGANPVKLATSRPSDRRSLFRHASWLSDNRVMLLPRVEVKPTEKVRWEFKIQAPPRAGVFREEFNLVAEYLVWFPAVSLAWQIEVGPAVYTARLKNQSPSPLVLKPAEEIALWVELENTGNVPWEKTGRHPIRLGTSSPLDRRSSFAASTWLSPNRPAALSQERVLPGESGRFEFSLKAPDTIGTYRETFRPVAEYLIWLNDPGIVWEIKVEQELVLQNPIRVGLTPTVSPVLVEGTGAFVVRDGADNLVVRSSGGAVKITPNGALRVEMGGWVKDVAGLVKIIPLNNSLLRITDPGVSNLYNTFRGLIRLERSKLSGRAWLVNDLELEDYLKGVAEMPVTWPLEALKSQAVIARTWALRARSAPVADIFDLYDDTRSQVYYGYNYEVVNPAIGRAVAETKGVVVKYGGSYASTYYHSDSGGYTANVENVWADGAPERAVPYLVAVPDPYAKPVLWQATITQDYLKDRFEQELKNAGVYNEAITNLVVSETYPSGRVKTVVFTASSGRSFSVGSRRFDYLTHNTLIKSMLFTIRKDAETSAPNFIFEGKGNGHGVGLSQWSAYNMASQGQNFEAIIKFFYSGTVLVNE